VRSGAEKVLAGNLTCWAPIRGKARAQCVRAPEQSGHWEFGGALMRRPLCPLTMPHRKAPLNCQSAPAQYRWRMPLRHLPFPNSGAPEATQLRTTAAAPQGQAQATAEKERAPQPPRPAAQTAAASRSKARPQPHPATPHNARSCDRGLCPVLRAHLHQHRQGLPHSQAAPRRRRPAWANQPPRHHHGTHAHVHQPRAIRLGLGVAPREGPVRVRCVRA